MLVDRTGLEVPGVAARGAGWFCFGKRLRKLLVGRGEHGDKRRESQV